MYSDDKVNSFKSLIETVFFEKVIQRIYLVIYIYSYKSLNVSGQGIKNIVCWPRPSSPPVFRLQKKWALEYGIPSTHAMVGVSIPFSVILYTMNRYQVSFGSY